MARSRAVPRPVAPAASEPVEGLNGRHAQVLTAIRLCHAMGYDQSHANRCRSGSQKRGRNFNNLLGLSARPIRLNTPRRAPVRALTDGEVPDRDEAYRSAINAISPRLRGVLTPSWRRVDRPAARRFRRPPEKSGGNFNNLLGAFAHGRADRLHPAGHGRCR